MSGVAAIDRVASRISEIQRAVGIQPSTGPISFHATLAAAAQRTDEPAGTGPAATTDVVRSEYTTLGGTPILRAAPATGLISGSDSVPPSAAWSDLLPEGAAPYVDSVESVALETGLDPRLLAGVVWAESTFVPDAVSSAGAIGLAQLMPGTAAGLGVDPWDPESNLRGGARYLVEQIERFGTLELGLAAYNAGPGRVVEHDGAPEYTRAYIDRVIGYYEMLGGSG
jgi:soluble lytic murein transglycosylase-like protein